MPLELVRKPADDGSIPVRELRAGQVGEIVRHSRDEYIGQVVKCEAGRLVGITIKESWYPVPSDDMFRVKVLPDGTMFRVVQNE